MISAKREKLACAIWAKEKCTTKYGIDIEAWENMNPEAKSMWISRADAQIAALKEANDRG